MGKSSFKFKVVIFQKCIEGKGGSNFVRFLYNYERIKLNLDGLDSIDT